MKRPEKGAWLRVLVHVAGWLPLALVLWDYSQDNLTANPVQAITQRMGKSALALLIASLACTPVNTVLDYKPVLRLRRPLGLYAFFNAALHFMAFVGLDYGFDSALIASEAFLQKPYIVVGLIVLLILCALAFTSSKYWMKRLGKNLKRLHQLVYLAVPLVIVHYIWSVKSDYREPALYGVLVLILLAARVPAVRRALVRAREKVKAVAPARSR